MNQPSPHNKIPNWLIWSLIIISFIGFLDAGYLTIKHYTGGLITCTLFEGCDIVTSSKYSEIFGIPVALGGLLYYLTVLISVLLYLDTKNNLIIKYLRPLILLGFLASAWFVYVQIVLLKAICQYCMLSATTSTLLFILALISMKYSRR